MSDAIGVAVGGEADAVIDAAVGVVDGVEADVVPDVVVVE